MTSSSGASAPRRDIILVVDDSPEALGFLTQALESDGRISFVPR